MTALINASTSSGLITTADTSGTLALQSNGATQFTVSSTGAYGQLKSGTAVASTSGTSIDFTSIPSWVKRVTIMFSGVSTNGTSALLIQIGDAGGIEDTGYVASGSNIGTGTTTVSGSTAGFILMVAAVAANTFQGSVVMTLISSNTWVSSGILSRSSNDSFSTSAGTKALSDTLTQLRITTAGGANTFDAGSINIIYEG